MCRTPASPLERQAVHVGAADDHGVGPQGQRPVDVGARADARAEQDWDLATDRVRDPRQDVDRPGWAVTAAPALVRHDDAVEATADRHPCGRARSGCRPG